MNPQIIIAAIIAAMGFAGGWEVRAWKAGSDHSAQVEAAARETMRRIEHVDIAANGHEEFKQTAAARERVVIKEVERVIEKPVYRNSCFDADGLRIIAADIAARDPASKPAPTVPDTPKP